ncbi:class I SAM-dependent methyltransferase [Rhodoferax sp.]|uniref:class I SAM-dependent methyltransferase n=1 Tax=Rhodoferax sp. TaxID=50421 RepID=UPI0019F2908B|nr:class I SAM-dependent methyltransferase [Rhodoferax sp.]MBE0474692.1 class I SAM-dependent methyltransferase [Rhodoferax sp.]
MPLTLPATPPDSSPHLLHWQEADQPRAAHWRSERGTPAPQRVVLVDDTTAADSAFKMACEGTALLWRGDFQNARHLLQAMARRTDHVAPRKRKQAPAPTTLHDAFNAHRQAQARRARILGMLLIELEADYAVPLRRAPDFKAACSAAWGVAEPSAGKSVVSLRELLGMHSAHEWQRVGVEIPALGAAPENRIHPHYGVFSPVRGEYIQLVATAHLPKPPKGQSQLSAFDIGTGTGVLAAVLARRGVGRIVATDTDPRALACARANVAQLGLEEQLSVVEADLFPDGLASLIVCNPPWLPLRPGSALERAVYDEDGRMLLGFLAGLRAHLAPKGEGWLIMSNLAELLGLRTRDELLALFERHGLRVVSRIDAKPLHPKAGDASDPLHQARAKEVTSLWRLAANTVPNS